MIAARQEVLEDLATFLAAAYRGEGIDVPQRTDRE